MPEPFASCLVSGLSNLSGASLDWIGPPIPQLGMLESPLFEPAAARSLITPAQNDNERAFSLHPVTFLVPRVLHASGHAASSAHKYP